MQVNGIQHSKNQPENLTNGVEQKTPKMVSKTDKTEKAANADIKNVKNVKNVKTASTSAPKTQAKLEKKGSDSLDKIAKTLLAALDSLMKMISSLLGKMESTKSESAAPATTKPTAETTAETKTQATADTAEKLATTQSSTAIEDENEIDVTLDDDEEDESINSRATSTKAPATKTEPTRTTPADTMSLQALTDDTGAIAVLTNDGYTIKAEGKDQAWLIIGPEGKSTRIWGDPHVYESDADKWDFKDRSSFNFGKNKVTVETVQFGNGATVTSNITIYNGSERVTISGIDQNKPVLKAVSRDGKTHDASLADGTHYNRGITTRGESWSTTLNGKNDVQGN